MLRSVNSARVKKLFHYFRYKTWERYDHYGLFGEDIVSYALNAGVVTELLYVSECGFPFENKTKVTQEVMDHITLTKGVNVAAVCRRPEMKLPGGDLHRILVLDRVKYRTNIGNILYLAYAFDVDMVITSEGDGINYYTGGIVRASGGALFFLPRISASIPEKLRQFREEGWYVVGTSLHNAKPISSIEKKDRMVLVVGNEQEGVSEEILKETDVNCRIEMKNYDSLNVVMATGILLHHFH